jgi:hypothetical protein
LMTRKSCVMPLTPALFFLMIMSCGKKAPMDTTPKP